MLHDYLYEFSFVADLGSIRTAAQHLGLAQSTLVRHLDSLKEDLGEDLFVRRGSEICLTPTGRRAASAGAELARLGDMLVRHFSNSSLKARQCAITVSGLTDAQGIAALLGESAQRMALSNLDVTLQYRDAAPVIDPAAALNDEECDIALVFGQLNELDSGAFFCRVLENAELAVVIPEGYHLAHRAALFLEDLAGFNFIRPAGNASTSASLWHEFARIAEQRIPITCRTLRAGITPTVSDFGSSDVLIVCLRTSQRAQYVGDGLTSIPVVDIRVPVSGIARADNAIACRLLSEAASLAGTPV